MAIKTISQFDAAVPTDNDYILFEQNGEGKHTTIGGAVNTCSLSYEEIMATNPEPDLTGKVASASALKTEIGRLGFTIKRVEGISGSWLPKDFVKDFGDGIFLSSTSATNDGFPYTYSTIITIVYSRGSRGLQICSYYQGAIQYRANTTENSWTAWRTVTLS